MAKESQPNRPWRMDELQEAFVGEFRSDEAFKSLSEARRRQVFDKVTRKVAKKIEKDLAKRGTEMLVRKRRDQADFEMRNLRRWRRAFDLLETLWTCCEEMGRNFNQQFRPAAVETEDFTFEALTSIHARSLLVASEIICLMKGGFADAALTRWRTLYELNVVAKVLSMHEPRLSLLYLAHADVQAAMYVEPGEGADEEDAEVLRRADYALANFGSDLKKHYGWACAVTNQGRPTFEHLEKLADKSEGRLLYKHASRHVHSNHRGYDQLLGVSESRETVLLVGPSNSGMVGPFTLAALTLADTSTLYLLSKPNIDRSIYALVLLGMADRMHKLAERIEERTLTAARKRRSAVA